jgi:ribosomal protein S18 acetylase RimI-like enzyme
MKYLSKNFISSLIDENKITEFDYREELFNVGLIKIFSITKEYLNQNIIHFINILADVEHEYWQEDEFKIDLECKWQYSIVMEIENIIVGYIIASKKNDRIHVHKFMIHPEFRNKKYGLLLLEAFIKNVKGHFCTISLKVYKDNIKAIIFYKKNGFITEYEKNDLFQLRKDIS